MEERDAAIIIARNIAVTNYSAIPKEAVESTKRSILDTLGLMVAGSGIEPKCRDIVEFVKDVGGRKESSILVFGGKVPAMMAAFANGAMSHVLNYDDFVPEAFLHPTSPTLAAAFAVAERIGKVNGKDFITAVTLAIDLIIRMALSVTQSIEGFKYDWHLTPLFGTFSSTAVAGKLLGLNEDKLADALGIAFLQAAGSFQMNWSIGVGVTNHRDAFPAKAGVLSALLAERGITGIKDCLQSKAGLYNLYFKGGYDPFYLTDNIGKRFEGVQVSIKAFPICGAIPTYATATLDIVREYDIHPEDIVEITVSFNELTQNLCEPLEERRSPSDRMSASLSIPFIVATAVAKRKINIGSFTPEALKDPVTLEVAQKVMTKFDSELNSSMSSGGRPGVVAIKTKNGESYTKRADFAYGHPKNPMKIDDLLEKFRDCVSYAAKPFPKNNIERAIELILDLEKIDDISQVIQLFT